MSTEEQLLLDKIATLESRLDMIEFANVSDPFTKDHKEEFNKNEVPDDTFRMQRLWDLYDLTDNDYKIIVGVDHAGTLAEMAMSQANYPVDSFTFGTGLTGSSSDTDRNIKYAYNSSAVSASHYIYLKVGFTHDPINVDIELFTSTTVKFDGVGGNISDSDEFLYVPLWHVNYSNSRINPRKTVDLRSHITAGYLAEDGLREYLDNLGGVTGTLVDGEDVAHGVVTSLT